MTLYEFLLTLHVIAAIIWLGASFLMALLIIGAERAHDNAAALTRHRDIGWLSPRLFVPASLSTFLLGLALVIESDAWGFDQLWITVGMAGWAFSFLLGFFYFRPTGPRLGALAMERGPDDPEVSRGLHKVSALDRVQVTVLFLVAADMVLKPTGDDSGILIAGAVIIAVAALLGAQAWRAGAGHRPSPERA